MQRQIILSVVSVFFTFSAIAQTQNCFQNINHPGFNSMFQVVGSDTIFREYILHEPASYDASTSTPLLINFHGFGGCASDYEEYVGDFYSLNSVADANNFLVAYPQAAWRPDKEDTYWEPGDIGGSDIYANDIYFVEQLILDIADSYNVDLSMVYVVGYSNGGMMTYSIACNRPDLVAGAGIVSGALLDSDCVSDNHVPIIIMHGIADYVLPYAGNQYYQSIAEVTSFWLNHNDIPTSSQLTTTLNDGDVLLESYSGGSTNTCLNVYTIYEENDEEAGHVWFSESIDGLTPNEILWDFFTGSCSTVNTNAQMQAETYLSLIPNPFFDDVQVNSVGQIGKPYYLFNGQGVLKQSGNILSEEFTLSLEDLPAALYFFKLGNTVEKILKVD